MGQLKKFFVKFVETIHRKKSLIIKISRIFGYFLLLVGLSYQIQRLYKKLKVEPEIFSKESSIQSSEIPFPAVTFCPPFTVKKEASNPEFLRLNNLTEIDLKAAMLQTCHDYNELTVTSEVVNNEINLVDVLLKTSQSINESIAHCGLNEFYMYYHECEKLFIQSITEVGICYTFNMLGHNYLFNEGISSDFDTFKRLKIAKSWDPNDYQNSDRHDDNAHPEPLKWNLETGYSVDDEHIQPARALKLQTLMLLTNDVKDQKLCVDREKSIKMILHMPNELPQVSYESIDIPFGNQESVMISAEMIKYEESLRDFPPKTRGCYFNGEKLLRFFKSYTKANCEYECLSNFTYETCGCVKFSMPRNKEMEVCLMKDTYCFTEISEKFPRSYYKNLENKRKHPRYPCGCLPSCTEIQYRIVKESKKDDLSGELQQSSHIKVVFANSQVKKTSNYATYKIENFIFDIGGLIGLFLGSSILSMLQIFVSACKIIKKYGERFINLFRLKRLMDTPPKGTPIVVIEVPIDIQSAVIQVEDL